jgi:hypothetical protein
MNIKSLVSKPIPAVLALAISSIFLLVSIAPSHASPCFSGPYYCGTGHVYVDGAGAPSYLTNPVFVGDTVTFTAEVGVNSPATSVSSLTFYVLTDVPFVETNFEQTGNFAFQETGYFTEPENGVGIYASFVDNLGYGGTAGGPGPCCGDLSFDPLSPNPQHGP